MMHLPTSVVVTWLFALWWLYVALRDALSPASPRYRHGRAVALALVAVGQLAWLGYLLLHEVRPFVLPVLGAFGLTWVLWVREAVAAKRRH